MCSRVGLYHLTDVVPPGEEQDASVVFLPVGEDKGEQHHPQDVVQRHHVHAALSAAKYGVHRGHEKDARPAVQTVVKEFS